MKIYISSLIIGIIVGLIYQLVNVRSPAPPTWALVGLLGMLIGEQLVPFAKEYLFHSSTVQPTSGQPTSEVSPSTSQNVSDINSK